MQFLSNNNGFQTYSSLVISLFFHGFIIMALVQLPYTDVFSFKNDTETSNWEVEFTPATLDVQIQPHNTPTLSQKSKSPLPPSQKTVATPQTPKRTQAATTSQPPKKTQTATIPKALPEKLSPPAIAQKTPTPPPLPEKVEEIKESEDIEIEAIQEIEEKEGTLAEVEEEIDEEIEEYEDYTKKADKKILSHEIQNTQPMRNTIIKTTDLKPLTNIKKTDKKITPQKKAPENKKNITKQKATDTDVIARQFAKMGQDGRSLEQASGNSPFTYPQQLWRQGATGTVVLKYSVTDSGKIVNIRVIKSSGYKAFDYEAAQTIATWKYKPGQGGKTIHPITFRLVDPNQYEASRLHRRTQ